LQWDQHINNITAKANKTLGFLRRNLKIPSIRIKEQAYQTLVRPLVEYASTVWNPYTKTEINKIEAVQRRAARYVVSNQRNRSLKLQMYIHVHVGTAWRLKGHNPGLKGFRCVQLHNVWWQQIPIPLANRRKDAGLMMMYKIDRELVSITKENRLIPPCRRSRNTHNRAFQIESCRIDTKSFICFGSYIVYVLIPLQLIGDC
jgi:hypothetical protein